MRKRLLSTLAAVAAGAGAAWGQSPVPAAAPPAPAPVGPIGAGPMTMPIGGPGMVVPPGIPGPPPGMSGPVGMGMPPGPGFDPAMGAPGYPAGVHGQPAWEPPFNVGKAPDAFNSRIAPKVWFDGEYLLWFAQAQPITAPYVTSGPPASGGILGRTGTLVLHSTTDIGFGAISGFRLSGGVFRDDARRYGWYLSGFWTEDKSNVFRLDSDPTGQPLIARPFVNALTGEQSALLVSFPTYTSGGITVDSSVQTFGAEAGGLCNLYRSCPEEGCTLWDINVLYGFRFLGIDENLTIEQTTTLLPGNTIPFDGKLYGAPATLRVIDDFETTTQFYGGQAGLRTTIARNRWSLGLTGKLALGVSHQRVEVRGESRLFSAEAGTNSIVPGGLYANASNIGRYNRDEFAVVPEVTTNLRYAWCSWLSTGIGYNFLYISRAARPGNLFTTTVNPALVPTSPGFGIGPLTPTPNPNPLETQNEFWIQGVNFEIALRF